MRFEIKIKAKGPAGCGKSKMLFKIKQLLDNHDFKFKSNYRNENENELTAYKECNYDSKSEI